jgi:hypothetical protein
MIESLSSMCETLPGFDTHKKRKKKKVQKFALGERHDFINKQNVINFKNRLSLPCIRISNLF